MSRYHGYQDDDAYRLPEGVQRVGYDPDTQTYTFQSANGEAYQSQPGSRYGRLVRASEAQDTDTDTVVDNTQAYRYFLPFLLLVILFLFLLIAPPWKQNFGFGKQYECDFGSMKHEIQSGDTCYEIAQKYSTTIDEVQRLNIKLDCDNLRIRSNICVANR